MEKLKNKKPRKKPNCNGPNAYFNRFFDFIVVLMMIVNAIYFINQIYYYAAALCNITLQGMSDVTINVWSSCKGICIKSPALR
jgi:hypothetical protein